jgi:hypothetical protein
MRLNWKKMLVAALTLTAVIIITVLGFAWKGVSSEAVADNDGLPHSLPAGGQGAVGNVNSAYLAEEARQRKLLSDISYLLAEDNLSEVFETKLDLVAKYLTVSLVSVLVVTTLWNVDFPLRAEPDVNVKERNGNNE